MTDRHSSLSLAEQIDSICDHFEHEFHAGKRPSIEKCLASVEESLRSTLFRALFELELELRQKAGEVPQVDEYEKQFPDFRAVIREAIEAQRHAASVTSSVKLHSIETSQDPRGQTPSSSSVKHPQRLGRFEIRSVLGEGAFGTVYRARDPQLEREVALKVPRFTGQQSRDDRERFLREARAAAGLQHSHICPVHEVGTIDGRDYIVLALIDGKPLSKLLQTKPQLSDRQVAAVVRKLALALQEAHAKGIIHRDLKPANIMINRKGEPVIMDFGLARRENAGDAQISQSGQIMGTPAYMSPEQARGDGKNVGPASDIYSLGVVLYELLCGRRPFEGTVTEVLGQILHVEAPQPSQFRPEVDLRLQTVCMKAIAKKPEERFASMQEFATALSEYSRATPGKERPPAPVIETNKAVATNQFADLLAAISSDVESKVERAVKKATPPQRTKWWTYLAGSALMGVIVLLGILFFMRKDTVTVIVNIPIENINDPSLSFLLDNNPIEATAFAAPIELKPGKHELVVNENGKLFKRFVFDVGEKQTDPVVQDVTPKPEAPVETLTVEEGFVSLFNGKDLTGWTPESNDIENWKVQDGTITAITEEGVPRPGAETWLLSDREYQDFLLRFEFRTLMETVNSGFGYRAVPHERPPVGAETYAVPSHLQVELFDNSANRANQALKTGTMLGSLGPQLVIPANPGEVQKPTGEWNRMEVEARGQSIRIRLNGADLVHGSLDDLIAQGATYPGLKRKSGRIAFQRLRGTIQFRDIQIKELQSEPDGWISLFNGKDLAGWEGDPRYWSVQNGLLSGRSTPDQTLFTYLSTTTAYQDFELQLQFRLNNSGNSGVQYRSDFDSQGKMLGHQADIGFSQIRQFEGNNITGDIFFQGNTVGNPFLATAQGGQREKVNQAFRVNDWNEMTISCRGGREVVTLNDIVTADWTSNSDGKPGRIAFQLGPKTSIEFRDVRIRPTLPNVANVPADVKSFNGHAYRLYSEQISWHAAKKRCEALGGHLVIIETLEENAFLAKLITDGGKIDSWIGATDEGSEGQWRWVDGRNMTWTNWFKQQPNNKAGVEHFGLMSNRKLVEGFIGWEWSDQPNESQPQHQPGYVCEWDALPAAAISLGH